MAKKIENIEQMLEQAFEVGHFETVPDCEIKEDDGSVTPLVKVYPGEYDENGKPMRMYSFYKDSDWQKQIERQRKSLERKINNRLNYGDDYGRAGVWRDNKTAIQLGKLKCFVNYEGWAPVLRRAYVLARQAPLHLRKYVYRNYLVAIRKKNREKYVLQDGAIDIMKFNYETAEVMPVAWYRDVEVHEFDHIRFEDMIADLQPEGMANAGDKVTKVGNKHSEIVHHLVYYPKNYGQKYGSENDSPSVLWYSFNSWGSDVCRFDQVKSKKV